MEGVTSIHHTSIHCPLVLPPGECIFEVQQTHHKHHSLSIQYQKLTSPKKFCGQQLKTEVTNVSVESMCSLDHYCWQVVAILLLRICPVWKKLNTCCLLKTVEKVNRWRLSDCSVKMFQINVSINVYNVLLGLLDNVEQLVIRAHGALYLDKLLVDHQRAKLNGREY